MWLVTWEEPRAHSRHVGKQVALQLVRATRRHAWQLAESALAVEEEGQHHVLLQQPRAVPQLRHETRLGFAPELGHVEEDVRVRVNAEVQPTFRAAGRARKGATTGCMRQTVGRTTRTRRHVNKRGAGFTDDSRVLFIQRWSKPEHDRAERRSSMVHV
jgi:hypothetical protein